MSVTPGLSAARITRATLASSWCRKKCAPGSHARVRHVTGAEGDLAPERRQLSREVVGSGRVRTRAHEQRGQRISRTAPMGLFCQSISGTARTRCTLPAPAPLRVHPVEPRLELGFALRGV